MSRKRKADEALAGPNGPDLPRVDENETLAYITGTHYETLYIDFSHRTHYAAEVFTYEGLRLCPDCLQFCHWDLWHLSRVTQCSKAVPTHAKPCDNCGIPLRPRSNDKQRHLREIRDSGTSLCDILSRIPTTIETWKPDPVFRSLVCPVCKLPGFDLDSMKAHLRQGGCDDRKKTALSQSNFAGDPVHCQQCNHWFNPRVFPSHVCGNVLDPVWLGRQDAPPDTSKPYIVWCHELPHPYGPTSYGGGYRCQGSDGAIPQEVLDRSWAAPFASRPRFTESRARQEDLNRLVHAMNRMLREDEILEVHNSDPDARVSPEVHGTHPILAIPTLTVQHAISCDPNPALPSWKLARPSSIQQGLGQGGVNQGKSTIRGSERAPQLTTQQNIDEKIRILREELHHLRRIKNEILLRRRGITYDQVKGSAKCHGVAWRHGTFGCRHGNPINLGTVILVLNVDTVRVAAPCCDECVWDSKIVESWTRYSKYSSTGQRLCAKYGCFEPLKTAVDCEKHDEKRRQDAVTARQVRLARLRDAGEDAPTRTKQSSLWAILSPDDVGVFFSNLTGAQISSAGATWVRVSESMTAEDYEGPSVFHIDTESTLIGDKSKGRVLVPLEVAILDRSGDPVINTVVDYGKSIQDLMQGCEPQHIAKACVIYGASDATAMTHGLTPEQLHQRLLAIGLGRQSILVEHSKADWDRKALATICGEDTPQQSINTFQLLRTLHYSGPLALQMMFMVCFPGSKLHSMHHRALWDVCKMFTVLKCVFKRRLLEEHELHKHTELCNRFKDRIATGPSLDEDSEAEDALDAEQGGAEAEAEAAEEMEEDILGSESLYWCD